MSAFLLPAWALRPVHGLWIVAVLLGALTAVLSLLFREQELAGTIALSYLLVTLLAAAIWGYLVGLAAAIVSDLLVNFFFVPPLYTFTVQEPTQAVQLVVFLAVAVVGASMLALLRRQATLARSREAEANMVLGVSHAVAHSVTPLEALDELCEYVAQSLHADGCAILHGDEQLTLVAATSDERSRVPATRTEQSAAIEARRRNTPVTLGGRARALASRIIGREAAAPITIVAFPSEAAEPGALRITGTIEAPPLVNPSRLLSAFAAEASTALHRASLADAAQEAAVLRRADEMKSVLLSSVSHDLRSPLTAIKASVDSLQDPTAHWTDEDTADFLDTIGSQADRLIATVSDLLQMSRLEGGAVAVDAEPLQVVALLRDAAQTQAGEIGGREVVIDAPEDLWIQGDDGLLLQAFGNLLQNAARYSTVGTPIRMRAEAAGDRVRVCVADEGPGIPPEDVPHVFEKFYRGVQAKRSTGTGLGLSIVRSMVELCGGTITVRSSPTGTEFTMLFSRAEAPR